LLAIAIFGKSKILCITSSVRMKARLVQGVATTCIAIGAVLAVFGNTVTTLCTSAACIQTWTVLGTSILAVGFVILAIAGMAARGGKIL